MTESDWLACTDARRILEFLRGKTCDRKLRLFACACCRCIWRLLSDKRTRRAVIVAERYADGLASSAELDKAGHAAWQAACKALANKGLCRQAELQDWAWGAVYTAILDDVRMRNCILQPATAVVEVINNENAFNPCFLLRDLFVYPLHAKSINDSCVATEDAVKLAQEIYDERAFERLPILADFLESAGCDNPKILGHCRQPGWHFRGCWAVDLLLGKK